MTEEEFLARWNQERPIYEKWGERVAERHRGRLDLVFLRAGR